VELKQKRKEVPDGECAQKGTAIPAVFTSPQQLSGNQSSLFVDLGARLPGSSSPLWESREKPKKKGALTL
jgi:hypothetical protein